MKLYSNITILFFVWATSIIFIIFFGFSVFPHSGQLSNLFWRNLGNWDGGHYLSIAQNGYAEKYQYAFFPLYPLLINWVSNITHDYLIAGLIISISSAFLAMHLLFNLVNLDFDKKKAQRVIIFLLIFPTSFYFLAVYSESLFLLLTIGTYFFARKKKLLLATILASSATATRLVGLAVAIGLLIEVLTTTGLNRKNWFVLFSFSGFVIYSLFLYRTVGDPFYFLVAEQHWQRTLSIPVFGFWETIKNLSQPMFIVNHFNTFLDLVFAIFGTGIVLRTFRYLPPSYAVYSLLSVLLPLFTPTLSSMPRFLLPIFPIFILIALTQNNYLIFVYQLISTMLLAAFAILFINGYWVG